MNILKVVANNYKEIDKDFTISFIPSANKYDDDKEFELSEIDDNLFVFTTMGFFGKNASGKTTAMEILAIVYDIFSNFRIDETEEQFLTLDKTMSLDVAFYHDGYVYRYKTDLEKDNSTLMDDNIVFKNEMLMRRKYSMSHSRNLFDYDKYEIMPKIELPSNTSIVYSVFKKSNLLGVCWSSNDMDIDDFSRSFEIYKSIDKEGKIINRVLQIFDSHIENISKIDNGKFEIKYCNSSTKIVDQSSLFNILSSGTIKGFGLLTFVTYSLFTGCDLIVDEIETHFHKSLVNNIIGLYKDKTVNRLGATLVFTSHYAELLDLFGRTDNIWFVDYKDKIKIKNGYRDFHIRTDVLKSNLFYKNVFGTNIDYEKLMDFKRELM